MQRNLVVITLNYLLSIALLTLFSNNICLAFERKLELVPLVGFRAGGSFEDEVSESKLGIDHGLCYGMALNYDFNPDSQLQLLWTRQDTEVKTPSGPDPKLDFSIDYLHFGSTYSGYYTETIRVYVIASLGATYLKPDHSNYDDELYFSAGLGGGIKYYFTDHIGFVLEARGFCTFMGGQTSVFCGSDQGCHIRTYQDFLIQFQGISGVVFRF